MKELLVMAHASGLFDKELFEDSMRRVDKYQDGVMVLQAFLRLFFKD